MQRQFENLSLADLVEQRADKVAGRKNPGIPYVGLEHIAQDAPVLLGAAPGNVSTSVNAIFKPHDILFGKLRPNLRKSLQVGFEGYCSTDILVLRARSGVDHAFAARVLQWDAVFREAVRTAEGTKMPRTSWTKLKYYRVFAPPLPEQRRIAEILDTADRAIEETEALIFKLKQMKTGLMHDLLTRGIDERGKLRDPEAYPEQFKDSPLGQIPKEWEVVRVEEAGEVRLGRQRSPQHQSGRFFVPYLRVANVFDGWIDYSDVLRMDFTPAERDIYGLLPGDILLNEGQSLELVGRSAVFDGLPGVYCYQNTLVRFRSNRSVIPKYCRGVFKHYLNTGRFMKIAKQTTSVAHLGADRFAKMPFPRPSVGEQHRIATVLDAQEARINAEEAYCDKLKLQKKGLMEDLLTGRVRVKTGQEVGA